MAYSYPNPGPDPGMEDMGEMQDSRPMTEENTPEDNGETIHIPEAFLQGTKFKEGDELILKVVSADADGLEVAYAKSPEKEGGEEESDNPRAKANAELDDLDKNDSDY